MASNIWATRAALAVFAISLGAAGSASAGGFALKEQSASAQGASFAGATAAAHDITYMYYNPAALSVIEEGFTIGGNISGIFPTADGTSTNGQSFDPGVPAPVAASYIGYRVNERLALGVSITAPFGLSTDYDSPTWTGAGDGVYSGIISVAVTPTVAFELTPWLSVGAGFSATYVDVKLTSNVNTGGPTAFIKQEASGWTYGYSLGALADLTETTRVGLSYRSGYNLGLDGEIEVINTGLPLPVPPAGEYTGEASGDLPGVLSIGLRQELNEDFALLLEAQWQQWSVFDVFVLDTQLGYIPEAQNYEDAFYYAAGLEYAYTDAMTLRTGVAYDETPTTDGPANRTVRLPDADRIWLSTGFSFDLTEHMTIDGAYSYLFGLDESVVTTRAATSLGGPYSYEASVHIFSLGGSMNF